MKKLGIYIHIPFCKSKCSYCDFYSVSKDDELADKYIAALINEISSRKDEFQDYKVDTVYFGGGTPSLLNERQIYNILNELNINYNIDNDPEITMEANPESLSFEKLASIKKNGVNRISLGIQSFNNEELKLLGRKHTSEDVYKALEMIKKAGFQNISGDLMFSLPNQKMFDFSKNIVKLAELSLPHISVYLLKLDKCVPLFKLKNNFIFVDEDEEFEMYEFMCCYLREKEYVHYEISNFAKEGFESRHNKKYWLYMDYLGLGTAAFSFVDGKRFYNEKDINKYISGKNIRVFENYSNEKEEIFEKIMLSLRLKDGIDVGYLENVCKPELFVLIEELVKNEYALLQNGKLFLSEKGMWVSNSIIIQITDLINI